MDKKKKKKNNKKYVKFNFKNLIKNPKEDDKINYKRVAIFVLVVATLIGIFTLIKEVKNMNKEANSEIITLGNFNLEDAKLENKVVTTYKAYKNFLKEYKVEGNLTKQDFKYRDYIISVQSFSQDYEKERKKLVEIANSTNNGIELVFNIYNYCEEPVEVELYAIIVPVAKNQLASGSKIENVYNDLGEKNCEVGE